MLNIQCNVLLRKGSDWVEEREHSEGMEPKAELTTLSDSSARSVTIIAEETQLLRLRYSIAICK